MSYHDEDESPIGYAPRERDVVPGGYYDAQIVGVYFVGRQFDNYYGKYDPKVKIKFEINAKNKHDKPVNILQDFTATMGVKANLRKLAHAIIGGDMTDDEAAKFRLSDFVGKHCSMALSVVPVQKEPGATRNKVTAFVPARQPLYMASVEPEIWDYRRSDPDDAPNWIWDTYAKSPDFKAPAKPRVPKPRGELAETVAAAQQPQQAWAPPVQPAAPPVQPAPAPATEKLPWE